MFICCALDVGVVRAPLEFAETMPFMSSTTLTDIHSPVVQVDSLHVIGIILNIRP